MHMITGMIIRSLVWSSVWIIRKEIDSRYWFRFILSITMIDWHSNIHSKKYSQWNTQHSTNNKQQENTIVQHQMIQTRFEVRDSNSNPSYDEFWTLFSSWLIDFDSRFFPEVKRQLQVGNSYILERAATTTIESSRTTPWRKRLNNDAGESNPYGSSATGWPNTLC